MIIDEEICAFVQVSHEEGQHNINGKECIHYQINRCVYPSLTTVPNAGKRLLETDVKFFISPLECRRNSKGIGDLVSETDVGIADGEAGARKRKMLGLGSGKNGKYLLPYNPTIYPGETGRKKEKGERERERSLHIVRNGESECLATKTTDILGLKDMKN
uniref:Uncharacterized protein n=1 Tax=Cucumis melo TaxID=3656 RepID=A0A9I9E916_CUCME